MKKISFMLSALALMAFAACSNESDEIVKNVKQIKLSATMETLQGSQNTRTAIAETETGGVVTWKVGDKIKVVDEKGESATLQAESDGASVTFAGTVEGTFGEIKYAFYPAESYSDFTPGGKATLTLEKVNQVATSLAGLTKNPSCATVSDGKATFQNVCGILQLNFNYEDEIMGRVFSLSGSAAKPITGNFTVDATDASIEAVPLKADIKIDLGNDRSFFCIVPGGSENLKVSFSDSWAWDPNKTKKTIKTTVERNKIINMPTLSIVGNTNDGFIFN